MGLRGYTPHVAFIGTLYISVCSPNGVGQSSTIPLPYPSPSIYSNKYNSNRYGDKCFTEPQDPKAPKKTDNQNQQDLGLGD